MTFDPCLFTEGVKEVTIALIKPDAVEAGKVDQILEDVSVFGEFTSYDKSIKNILILFLGLTYLVYHSYKESSTIYLRMCKK